MALSTGTRLDSRLFFRLVLRASARAIRTGLAARTVIQARLGGRHGGRRRQEIARIRQESIFINHVFVHQFDRGTRRRSRLDGRHDPRAIVQFALTLSLQTSQGQGRKNLANKVIGCYRRGNADLDNGLILQRPCRQIHGGVARGRRIVRHVDLQRVQGRRRSDSLKGFRERAFRRSAKGNGSHDG